MGLIINHGSHKEEEKIVSQQEIAQITKITPADEKVRKNSFNVQLTIIGSSKHKGKTLLDLIPYDPADGMSFKYKAIRRAAKCPVDPKENRVEIEKLLLNKAVPVKLSVREYEGNEYQNIQYLVPKATTPAAKPLEGDSPKETPVIPKALDNRPATPQPEMPADPNASEAISDDDFPF